MKKIIVGFFLACLCLVGVALAQNLAPGAGGPYGGYQGWIPRYPQQPANYVLASPDGVDGSPVMRALVAGDISAFTSGLGVITTPISIANGGTGSATFVKNTFLIGPVSGANAAPTRRAMVAADLPSNSGNTIPTTTGTGAAVATGSTNLAGKITGATDAGTTAVTVTFANSGFPSYAFCAIAPYGTVGLGAAGYISAQSNTAFTITYTATANATFQYVCNGN